MFIFHFVGCSFIGNLIERFAASAEAPHEKGNGAGGGDGEKCAVPQTVLFDVFIQLGI